MYKRAVITIALFIAVTIAMTLAINTQLRHDEPLVYITRTGDKFHSADCGYLRSSAIPIGKIEAINKGYVACSRCGGKSVATITVNNYGSSFGISIIIVASLFSLIIILNKYYFDPNK